MDLSTNKSDECPPTPEHPPTGSINIGKMKAPFQYWSSINQVMPPKRPLQLLKTRPPLALVPVNHL